MMVVRERGMPCKRCGAAGSCAHSEVEGPVEPLTRNITTSAHHKGLANLRRGKEREIIPDDRSYSVNGTPLGGRKRISGGGIYSKVKRTKHTDPEGYNSGTKFRFGD